MVNAVAKIKLLGVVSLLACTACVERQQVLLFNIKNNESSSECMEMGIKLNGNPLFNGFVYYNDIPDRNLLVFARASKGESTVIVSDEFGTPVYTKMVRSQKDSLLVFVTYRDKSIIKEKASPFAVKIYSLVNGVMQIEE